MVQIQRIAFYIVPSGHILKSHHGTMHWVKASTLRNEVQPPIQPLVPALIIYVALVVVSYEPEHDVNTVRVPSWRGAHSNLAQLAQRPVTVELGVLAILIGLVIALPVGIYSAIRQDTAADYVGRSVAIIGLATPNFWLGIMVMIYPAIWWGWAPPLELVSFTDDPLGNLAVFLIPSLILGTASAAAIMRMTRTMMLEVLRQDYIRTAWSKGLKERAVVIRHAVKNAFSA